MLTRILFICPNGQSWQYPPQEMCSTPWAQLARTSCWGDEEETRRWIRRRWTMRPAQLFHESRPRGGGWSEHSFNTTETNMWSNVSHKNPIVCSNIWEKRLKGYSSVSVLSFNLISNYDVCRPRVIASDKEFHTVPWSQGKKKKNL